jgi:predicted nucleic acid-binding protein
MAIKLFLDTNIILDILDRERPFSKESEIIFKFIEGETLLAYFSESVVTTTDYVLKKKFTNAKRVNILTDLLQLVTIIECTNSIVQNALLKNESDVEDAILYELALTEKLDYFITNDKQALKKLATKKLPILNTKDFLMVMNIQ